MVIVIPNLSFYIWFDYMAEENHIQQVVEDFREGLRQLVWVEKDSRYSSDVHHFKINGREEEIEYILSFLRVRSEGFVPDYKQYGYMIGSTRTDLQSFT